VLLEGEIGIGKTRLAAALLAWVRVQGAKVLAGRAVQTSQRLSIATCQIFEPVTNSNLKAHKD